MRKKYRFPVFLVLLFFFILTIFIFTIFEPEKVVENIGIGNTYLIIFIVGVIAGFSFLVSHNFLILYIAFISAGVNPIILGLLGSIGITIGDFLAYAVGFFGRNSIEDPRKNKKIKKLSKWIEKQNKYTIFGFIYLYSGFFIFPKDILCGALGFVEYPIKKIVIPLFLGNLSYNLGIAFLVIISVL